MQRNEVLDHRYLPDMHDHTASSDRLLEDLPPGTPLRRGKYVIDSYFNSGSVGITYYATDRLEQTVIIKECFPSVLCRRNGMRIAPRKIEYAVELSRLIEQYLKDARALAELRHKNILHVREVFEENDTAYIAIDLIDGRDLLEVIENSPDRLTPDEIVRLTRSTLGAIKYIHDNGLLHRDISPDNILVDATGEPVLIDFGTARRATNVPGRVFSMVKTVKDGYSPQEFYIEGSDQGPWSDLYSLAATVYHAISGGTPIDSQHRISAVAQNKPDPYVPLAGRFGGYPDGFLDAIDNALGLMPRDRLQSADDWLAWINVQQVRIRTRQRTSMVHRDGTLLPFTDQPAGMLFASGRAEAGPGLPKERADALPGDDAEAPISLLMEDLAPEDEAEAGGPEETPAFEISAQPDDANPEEAEDETADEDVDIEHAEILEDREGIDALESAIAATSREEMAQVRPRERVSGPAATEKREILPLLGDTFDKEEAAKTADLLAIIEDAEGPSETLASPVQATRRSGRGRFMAGAAAAAIVVTGVLLAAPLMQSPDEAVIDAAIVPGDGLAEVAVEPITPRPAPAETDAAGAVAAAAPTATETARATADSETEDVAAMVSEGVDDAPGLSAPATGFEETVEPQRAEIPSQPPAATGQGADSAFAGTPSNLSTAIERSPLPEIDEPGLGFPEVFAFSPPSAPAQSVLPQRVAVLANPEAAVAGVLPAIDQIPPAPLSPERVGSVAAVQVVSTRWMVETPFRAELELVRNANTARITEVVDRNIAGRSGDWIAEGAVIYAFNGERLRSGEPLSAHILGALVVDPDGFARAAVRYRDPINGRIDRGLLAVPAFQELSLLDQTRLTYRHENGRWVVRVESVPGNREGGLRPGDVVVSEQVTGTPISDGDALSGVFDRLVAFGAVSARFIVERDGAELETTVPLARAE